MTKTNGGAQLLQQVTDLVRANLSEPKTKDESMTRVVVTAYLITVNGQQIMIGGMQRISYEMLVAMAQLEPSDQYTVTYRGGPTNDPQGGVIAGGSAPANKGLIVNVVNASAA